MIYFDIIFTTRNMTRLICLKNANPLEGMEYELSPKALTFLDKINSSLITRDGKDSWMYKECLLSHRNPSPGRYEYTYNEEGEYFIKSAGLKGIEFRTHPDLIAYVEAMYPTPYKIVNFPKGKVFTEIVVDDNCCGGGGKIHLMIVSDGPAEVV